MLSVPSNGVSSGSLERQRWLCWREKYRHDGQAKGVRLGRWLAGKLMKELDIPVARYRCINTNAAGTNTLKSEPSRPAVRGYRAGSGLVRRVTYIWTGKCWAYLAVVLDLLPANLWAGRCRRRRTLPSRSSVADGLGASG